LQAKRSAPLGDTDCSNIGPFTLIVGITTALAGEIAAGIARRRMAPAVDRQWLGIAPPLVLKGPPELDVLHNQLRNCGLC
jgi:hypothetical protein